MKKIILPILALSMSSVAVATTGEFKDIATCYVYHQDKLLKTLSCPYEGAVGARFEITTYKLNGFGKMTTYSGPGPEDTLNDEPAVVRVRLIKDKSKMLPRGSDDAMRHPCILNNRSTLSMKVDKIKALFTSIGSMCAPLVLRHCNVDNAQCSSIFIFKI